jgi:hypothetical protein
MTCSWVAAESKERNLFEWESPPGVTVHQRFVVEYINDYNGTPLHGPRFWAECGCGLVGPSEKLRCDAINRLTDLHRGPK